MLKKCLWIFLILAAGCFLSGCDSSGGKYEIVRAGNQTYLLNKSTGESKIIDGSTLVSITAPEAGKGALLQSKQWPEQSLTGVGAVKAIVKTKYRDGQMLYVVRVRPYEGPISRAVAQIYLQPALLLSMTDSDAFEVGRTVELKLSEASKVVDAKGDPTELEWTGGMAMSLAAYEAVNYVSIGWRGFQSPPKN